MRVRTGFVGKDLVVYTYFDQINAIDISEAQTIIIGQLKFHPSQDVSVENYPQSPSGAHN